MGVIESVASTITGWWVQNAKHYIYYPIPKDRTDWEEQKNRNVSEVYDQALKPYGSYFRLWLSEMYLTKSVAWGTQCFPAVHAEVKLEFGDQQVVTFSRVARPPENELAKGVKLNYRLTELMPYRGGLVEIDAALLALKGADYLGAAIGVLQQFSGLVTVPLGEVLSLASKVAIGSRDLLSATKGNVHLGLHDTFASEGGGGKAIMKSGYIAIVLATEDQVNKDRLSVQDDQLYYEPEGKKKGPLENYDYMLFRIEGRAERDDWRLRNIDEPLKKARTAFLKGNTQEAQAYKLTALAAAFESPDIADLDRRRVVTAIKEELADMESGGQGATTSAEERDLDAIMKKRPITREEAAAMPKLRSEEVFAL
jgi:hypothetical protein